jgi:predicted nuclease of predicted toxin-antitoxin system
MRLLLDHNLSLHLARRLGDVFPGSSHTALLGLSQATDNELWTHAAQNDYVIVTKDSDFNDLSVVRGFPPKVIWLRLGNCTTAQVEQALRRNHPTIMAFAEDSEAGILELY